MNKHSLFFFSKRLVIRTQLYVWKSVLAIAIYFCMWQIFLLKSHTTVVSYSNESVSFKFSPLGPKGNPLLAPAPWVAVRRKYNRWTFANPWCSQCSFGARSAKEGKSWLLRSMGFRRNPYCRGFGQIWKMGFHAPLVSLGFQVSL